MAVEVTQAKARLAGWDFPNGRIRKEDWDSYTHYQVIPRPELPENTESQPKKPPVWHLTRDEPPDGNDKVWAWDENANDEVVVAIHLADYELTDWTHWTEYTESRPDPPTPLVDVSKLRSDLDGRIEEARRERDAAADDGDYESAIRWRTRAEAWDDVLEMIGDGDE
jgi:hypothetical protein